MNIKARQTWKLKQQRIKDYQVYRLYTNRYTFDEILSPSDPLFKANRKGWNRYADILKFGDNLIDHKRTNRLSSTKYARIIVREFMELVFSDMINLNVTFHFPIQNTIKFRIARKLNAVKYDIETFGNTFVPWINFGWNFKKRTSGFYYYLVFSKFWNEKLLKETLNGHSYRDGLNREHQLSPVRDYKLIDKAFDNEVTNVDKYV